MIRPFLLLAACLLSGSALAGATDWQEAGPEARMRFITSDVLDADGTTLVALEIDMPAHLKTYWRVPGETGVPLQVDLAGSSGVPAHEIVWPYPTRETGAGYLDYVYYGHTVLPLRLTLDGSAPARLKASVFLGICWEICVPVSAEFEAELDFDSPDAGQDLRIRQALALAPADWQGPGEPVGDAQFDAETDTLSVAVDASALDPQSLIADTDDPAVLFGAPQKSPIDDILSLPLLSGRAGDLHGQWVNLTFMTVDGAFETRRRIGGQRAESGSE